LTLKKRKASIFLVLPFFLKKNRKNKRNPNSMVFFLHALIEFWTRFAGSKKIPDQFFFLPLVCNIITDQFFICFCWCVILFRLSVFFSSIPVHFFYLDNYHSDFFHVIILILFVNKLNYYYVIILKENQLPLKIKHEKFIQTWKIRTNIKSKDDVHTHIKIK
jgi:hypothetical protein